MNKLLSKYRDMSVQAKAAIWFAVCSVLQKGISFITVPIFTRLLTTEEYGTYSLYLSWLQIMTIITSLYVYHGVFNNGMTKYDKDRDVYISAMQGLTLTLTACVFIVYIAMHNLWSEILGLSPVLIVLMFIEMSVTPALQFWSGRQRFEFKYKKLVAVTLLKSIANPFLGLIMVIHSQNRATARITSLVVIEVVFCGLTMLRQFIKGRRFIHISYWKYALGLAIPLLPHYLSSMILNQGDRIMIDRMVGKSEVAFYSIAYSIGMLTQILTTSINNSFIPWMYQRIKAFDFEGVKRTVNILLLFVALFAVCLMMFSPELVLIFGSEEYASAVYVIPPVAASVYFIFLYNILVIPQFYFERTRFIAISSILAAVVNIILNYIFIRLFGFVSAGYTSLICYVLYSIGHHIVSRKLLREKLGNNELFNKEYLLYLSFLLIAISVGCNLLFDYWYIRYAILFGFAMGTFIKRDEVLRLVKDINSKG